LPLPSGDERFVLEFSVAVGTSGKLGLPNEQLERAGKNASRQFIR
jgi:hypothetical protein